MATLEVFRAASACACTQPMQASCLPKYSRPFSAIRTHLNSQHAPRKTLAEPCTRRSVAAQAADTPSTLGLQEAAALDELIDMLLNAKDAEELTQKVAENMLSFDQRFWLRLATRTDSASDAEEQDKLSALAKVVMQLVDAMVRKTNDQLSESAQVLQDILRAAADEATGEWTLPLQADKVLAMKTAMEERADHMDEALLSNCFAWMRKASEDKLDGMVAILQKVLQLYAAKALAMSSASLSSEEVGNVIDATWAELLGAQEEQWAEIILNKAEKGEISEVSFLESLQRRMESVVLGLSSGSYAQRVQAEYLKELESRAKQVFADLAACS